MRINPMNLNLSKTSFETYIFITTLNHISAPANSPIYSRYQDMKKNIFGSNQVHQEIWNIRSQVIMHFLQIGNRI